MEEGGGKDGEERLMFDTGMIIFFAYVDLRYS